MKIARNVKVVETGVLEKQFYKFTHRLDTLVSHQSTDSLHNSDSKELIKIFSTLPSLYEGIEMVMQCAYVASIKVSVESIAESVISVYNRHNNDIRPLSEDQLNDEMFVAWNGPELGEDDIILNKALNLHFSGSRLQVHFKTNNLFVTAGASVVNILNMRNTLNIY